MKHAAPPHAFARFTVLSAFVLGAGMLISLSVGRFPVSYRDTARILLSLSGIHLGEWSAISESVILNLRLPRVILAVLCGAGLSITGAIFQGIFRNPLVSPGVVGVTSGAGFGAALALLLFGWGVTTQLFAFVFGILALLLTWSIARKTGGNTFLVFVLAGVIVNMFAQAMISLLKFLADSEETLPAIVYWLMGSLSSASWEKLALSGPMILVCSVLLLLLRRRINLLSLGEETVRSLGVNPRPLISIILVLTTLIVSAVVSVAGVVGWVGLIVPHITRMIIGADHERLIPGSALVGGILFVGIDTAARSLSAHDLPLGILIALIGAPLFIALLLKTKGVWEL